MEEESIFPNLGFDTFTSEEYMARENETESKWLGKGSRF